MTNFFIRVVLFFSCLSLLSCAHHFKAWQGNKATALCEQTCNTQLVACKKVCRSNCQYCAASVNYSAVKKYRRYVHERCVKGENVVLQLNSYRDPLQCRKITCDCRADYLICMQSCGGVIYKRLRVAPVCC